MMQASELIASLVSCPRVSFDSLLANRDIRAEIPDQNKTEFLLCFACALAESDLYRRDRAHRFKLMAAKIRLPNYLMLGLAQGAGSLSGTVKGIVADILPSQLVSTLYGASSPPDVATQTEMGVERSRSLDQSTIANVQPREAATILLMSVSDQTANRNILEGNDYSVLRVSDIDELENVLTDDQDICGCVIDGSFLRQYDQTQQERALELAAQANSFTWIRIHEDSLLLSPEEIQKLLKRCWCLSRDISANQLSIRESGIVKQGELGYVKNAHWSLNAYTRHEFEPGDLDKIETRLLAAALSDYARDWDDVVSRGSLSLRVRRLFGGRTLAKIVLIEFDRRSEPVVAKVDTQECISDESRRFLTYISPWQTGLEPRTHFLGNHGVMLLRIVGDGDFPEGPAPVLFDQLRKLYVGQLYPNYELTDRPDLGEMIRLLISAVDRLAWLNKTAASSFGVKSFSPFMDLDHLRIPCHELGFSLNVWSAYDWAVSRFSLLESRGTVHGDVNLHNILVVQNRIPYFIDFANSGPGHPAFDLVRLEVALFLGAFVQCCTNERCRELQKAISFGDDDAQALSCQFPDVTSLDVNKACVEGMVATRNRAIEVIEKYGGSRSDYLAVKFLVAWCGMVTAGLQVGLAREIVHVIEGGLGNLKDI